MLLFSKPNLTLSLVLSASAGQHVVLSQNSSAAWEQALVDAWATIGDCSPDTGMCEACGFGVAVVDLNGPNGAETRISTTGPGDLDAPWDADSTWEIASITKPFTALATLILEEEGVVNRTSTIGDFLDCDWDSANSDVKDVTLIEIIQHESGFPAQPPDRGPSIDGNPFGGYTEDRLCASLLLLNGLPTRGRYSYSNYAYGTLGYVLTLAVDKEDPPDYEEIIKVGLPFVALLLLEENVPSPLTYTTRSGSYPDSWFSSYFVNRRKSSSRSKCSTPPSPLTRLMLPRPARAAFLAVKSPFVSVPTRPSRGTVPCVPV